MKKLYLSTLTLFLSLITFSQTTFENDLFESENIAVSDHTSEFLPVKKANTSQTSKSTEEDFSIFPNPATSYVQIKNSSVPIQNVELYNVLGQKVYSEEFKNVNEIEISVDSFKDGLYLLKINNSYTRKLIIN